MKASEFGRTGIDRFKYRRHAQFLAGGAHGLLVSAGEKSQLDVAVAFLLGFEPFGGGEGDQVAALEGALKGGQFRQFVEKPGSMAVSS